jgi:NAD(P)H-dependent flavin oxidoreductase YrpB (nitropropane dioxygenase family)
MKTRITALFGNRHPIIQGGMHYVGFAQLAAAVSNAGGLGIITGLPRAAISECRQQQMKTAGSTGPRGAFEWQGTTAGG